MVVELKGMKNLHSNRIKQSALQIHSVLKIVWFMRLNAQRMWLSPHITHIITSAGSRHGWHLFHLIGPLLQALDIYHGLLYTFHLNICKMPVCHRFVLENPRVEQHTWWRECTITFASSYSLFFTSSHVHSHPSSSNQKQYWYTFSKSSICLSSILYLEK